MLDYTSREKVEKLLNVKKQKSIDVLNEMLGNNLIIKEKKGRNTIYKLK